MFHVIYIHNHEIWVRVPGWSTDLAVRITTENVAPDVLPHLKTNGRYFGMAAIGADTWEGLNILINEMAPAPDPNDGLGEVDDKG